MSSVQVGIIGVVVLVILMILRVPVAYSMVLVGFAGFAYVHSVSGAFNILGPDFWSIFSSYNLSVLPMFIFMGSITFYAGISGRLYDSASKFVGHFRGGLALATTLACAAFGAMCGSTIAGAAAMGKVTIPAMDKYGYDKSISTGCVAAAGSLAILIPPSGILIVYGTLVEESIGKLFAAGILPGILLTVLFFFTVLIVCRVKPKLAPAGPKYSWNERVKSLNGVIEMVLLFALIMGGLFTGWFTPTEAGAWRIGALILPYPARAQLGEVSRALENRPICAMVYLILAGATIFGRFMAISQLPFALSEWIGSVGIPSGVVMGMIVLGYLVAGCFMDSLAMITLTVPILFGVVTGLGFNSIWFGILIVLVVEMGAITPPVGINVFTIKGVAPDVPLGTIYKGIYPFLGAIVLCAILVVIFPQIILFIPSLMK
jgi:tripartite ATP-independent transporter DctM subunit